MGLKIKLKKFGIGLLELVVKIAMPSLGGGR